MERQWKVKCQFYNYGVLGGLNIETWYWLAWSTGCSNLVGSPL